jgi:hypothetical protein
MRSSDASHDVKCGNQSVALGSIALMAGLMGMYLAPEPRIGKFSGRKCKRGLPRITRCAADNLNALGAEYLDRTIAHVAGNEMCDSGARKDRSDTRFTAATFRRGNRRFALKRPIR